MRILDIPSMLHVRNIASGSSGNSTLIWTENTRILVDAGVSALQIKRKVEKSGFEIEDIDAIIISHEHVDHIRGVERLSNRYGIKVYANDGTWLGINESKYVKKGVDNRGILRENMLIGDIRIESFPVSHDAIDPVGFKINNDGDSITMVTDVGHVTGYLLRKMEDSSLIMLEANHDVEMLRKGPYPYFLKERIMGPTGHLSNDECGYSLSKISGEDLQAVILAHISEKNNTPELAEKTVKKYVRGGVKILTAGKEIGPEVII